MSANYETKVKTKQTGTGPSRRHIEGSKKAKGLQNVKVLVNLEPFMIFLKKVSQ